MPAEYTLMRFGNFIVGIGVIAFHSGYRFLRSVELFPKNYLGSYRSNPASSTFAAITVSVIALSALGFIVKSSGADLSTLQGESQQILRQGTLGFAYNVFQWLPICSLFLLYQLHESKWKWIPLIHILLLIAATTILTRREPLIFLVLGLMAFYGTKVVVPRLKFSLAATIVLLLFVLVGYLRVAAQTGELELGGFLLAYLYVGEFWVYDMFLVILREGGSNALPWRYGLDITPGFFDNFFPFMKLPDNSIGDQLGEALNPLGISRAGIPPSIFGMLYLNYSVAGVVLGLFMLGALMALVERWRKDQKTNFGWMVSALAYIWFGYVLRNAAPYNVTLLVLKLAIGAALIFIIKLTIDWALFRSKESDSDHRDRRSLS